MPVFLAAELGWDFWQVGGFLAAWVIGYGLVQAAAPRILRQARRCRRSRRAGRQDGAAPRLRPGRNTRQVSRQHWRAVSIRHQRSFVGLIAFAVVFAINSAVHSYLILAYTDSDKVALNVGFYYMANAGGRLIGTILSGLVYQSLRTVGCLVVSTIFVLITGAISLALPTEMAPLTRPIASAKARSKL